MAVTRQRLRFDREGGHDAEVGVNTFLDTPNHGVGPRWHRGSEAVAEFQKILDHPDGELPAGSLTLDATGDIYGATTYGGLSGCGVVFEITP
jgi:uncharacterized repeat protein (TIGR03803 family)